MDKEKKYNLVHFEIVGFCNARCPWCVTGNRSLNQVSYPSSFINVNDFRNAIVTLLEGGLIYPRETLIRLDNWGEPMLHPELSEILKILKENDLNFALSTNASKFVNLENDVLGNLQQITFSVPGFSQSSYDRIHGFNLESILKNIEMFCKNIRKEGSSAKLMMAYHLYQFNIDEIDAAMKFCSLNGIEFSPYSAYPNDFNLGKAYLNKSISTELLRRIGKDLFLHYVDESIARTPQDYHCPQFNILTIDEYCNVLTCCVLPKDHPEYSLGNLFTLSSDDIRKGKLSQKVCIECVKLGISSWVHNPLVPGFINILETKGAHIANLETNLQEKDAHIGDLETNLQEKGAHIADLETSLQEKVAQINRLEFQIYQIQHSIPMQLVNRYQRVIERLLRPGTRRRHYYELGLTGIRVILNEGWKSFFRKARYRLTHRYAAIKRPRHDLPKFNASISIREAKELTFPVPSEKPEVSIVIPAHNSWRYTLNCLKSICENTDGDYEVVVMDDASTDATAEVLSKVKNLYLVTNEQNEGFVESCNRGAKNSKGKYILFLNNDTMVTKGWLPPLMEIIRREDVGAAGSKFLFPDGTLQEAGSIVWRNGSALGYGRGDDPDKPEYSYVREVDYCSGAGLMVRRELFEEISGFDARFKPAYYEDADLCFAVRDLGYRVMYQPLSVIVHLEGVTCGTDTYAGIKKYQEINRPKFVEKWKTALDQHDYYEGYKNILSSRNRRTGKSILILDDRIPDPGQGSGYPRAYRLLKFVEELGYKVTFFPLDNATPWQPYTNELQQLGIEVFYGGNLNLSQFAERRAGYYDVVLVSRPHNMEKAFDIVKRFFPEAALLYDAEAIFAMRDILKARVRGDERMEKVADGMMNQELNLVKKADLIITVSENERKVIAEKTGATDVAVWGHPVEVKEPHTPFDQRKDILFVGGFLGLDSPNEDAILYFAGEVFPRVANELPCRLFIVGMNPPDSLGKLASSSVIVTGYVEDLREYYEKCRIFVVPHRYSAGIPLKLLEAMGHGIPSIVSKLTASQLALTDGKEVLAADTSEEFAEKVIKLYQDEKLWHKVQHHALSLVREKCAPENMKAVLNEIILQALQTRGGE